ncbi:MAG: helix-turn-helix domain-containing protein [Hyphomicrobiaceae bacterium]
MLTAEKKSRRSARPAKFRSEVAETVHEGVRGLHRLGLVDKQTMREFDVRCLTLIESLSGEDIVALREREGVSQAVLARCLNVTTNYVSQIERGAKRPGGSTLKLLTLIKSKGLAAIL